MASLLKKVLHSTSSRTPQDLVAKLCAALERISEASTEKQQEDAAKLLYQMKVCRPPVLPCRRCPSPGAACERRRPGVARLVAAGSRVHACVDTPCLQPEAKPGSSRPQLEACCLAWCAQTAIFGDGETEPSKDTAVSICHETCRCGLPSLLANKLALLDFEARKDAAQARPGFSAAWQPRQQLVAPSVVQWGCSRRLVSLGCCHLWCPATHPCCLATRLADAWETHGRPVDSLSSSRLVGCVKQFHICHRVGNAVM